jgi:AcrR family transcriptional regulator
VIDRRVKRGQRSSAVEDARRLTPQGLERKQQLLDCAAELFAERGYAETRIIDIVRSAGVAKGLFYWYFENKEALFTELAENIRFRLRKHQAQVIDPAAPPLVRLRQGTEGSVRFMAEHAHFFSLLEVERANFTEVLRQGTEQHLDDVEALVREGQADGAILEEDPRLLALGIVGVVGHYSHVHRAGRLGISLDDLAAFVGRFVVRSVATSEELAGSALDLPARAVQTR